jgi:hypothetical protein
MNDKLVIAVLCFGSHICNQAARIRVTISSGLNLLVKKKRLYSLIFPSASRLKCPRAGLQVRHYLLDDKPTILPIEIKRV